MLLTETNLLSSHALPATEERRSGCLYRPSLLLTDSSSSHLLKTPILWKPIPSNYTAHCPPPHRHYPLTELPTPSSSFIRARCQHLAPSLAPSVSAPQLPLGDRTFMKCVEGILPPTASLIASNVRPPSPPATHVLHHAFPVSLPMTTRLWIHHPPAPHSVTMSCSAN